MIKLRKHQLDLDKVRIRIDRGLLSPKIVIGLENALRREMTEGFTFKKDIFIDNMWIDLDKYFYSI